MRQLKQAVPTRWGSQHICASAFLDAFASISALALPLKIPDAQLFLSIDDSMVYLTEVCSLLQPVREGSERLSSPDSHIGLPWIVYKSMQQQIERIEVIYANDLKEELLKNLKVRLPEPKIVANDLHSSLGALALIVDPRYKISKSAIG